MNFFLNYHKEHRLIFNVTVCVPQPGVVLAKKLLLRDLQQAPAKLLYFQHCHSISNVSQLF